MINPSSIDLSSLPWLPLDARSAFPRQPAIYFAIDSQNQIQYIGRSINPQTRWQYHHQYRQLQAIGSIRIAYLFMDADLLPEIEEALISWFNPPLNTVGKESESPAPSRHNRRSNTAKKECTGLRVRQIREIEVEGLGDRIKTARLASSKSLEQLCEEVGVSRTYWYDVEKETLKGTLSLENLRKIEQALNVNLGVKFAASE